MSAKNEQMQGWGTHISTPSKPITTPTTKDQLIRQWRNQGFMDVPGRSGRIVRIDIHYATSEAYEEVGGRKFDSLVSMHDRAFFVIFCADNNEVVQPSTRPILCVPGLSVENSWWILPAAPSE